MKRLKGLLLAVLIILMIGMSSCYAEHDSFPSLTTTHLALSQEGAELQQLPTIHGELNPGDVESHEVLVGDVLRAAFVLNCPWEGLSLTVTSPSGKVIDPLIAEHDPDIEYVQGYDVGGFAGYTNAYSLMTLEDGKWQMHVTAAETMEESARYTVSTYIASHKILFVDPKSHLYQPGDPIKISARLTRGDEAITGASVRAELSRSSWLGNSVHELVLYDDGHHDDSKANDGFYANTCTDVDSQGIYDLIVIASGVVNDVEFIREDRSTIWVKLYPDLAIDEADISFSNNNPDGGETIIISATVRNIGRADVKNAVIDFFDGPPRYDDLLGEVKLTVSAGGSAQATVKWNATAGDHEIYVGISPYNAFLDSDYSNNGVFTSIHVIGPAVVADAGGPYVGDEGYPAVFDASGSTGPGGAPLQYRWDFDSNGSWNIVWLNIPIGAAVWMDDGNHSVTVEVSNGVLSSRDTANVTVRNVVPAVQIVAETQTPGDSHVIFDGSNFIDPGIEDTHTIEWDFGDGESTTGTLAPTHTYDKTGEYTVMLTVTDDDGGVGTDTLTVTVDTVSAIPVAVNDDYSINEDTMLEMAVPGVLTNDSDMELTVVLVGNVGNGDLTLKSDGSFIYTPDADFNGSDTFTYKAVAGASESDVATVTITIDPVNDAPAVVAGSDQTVNDGDTVAFLGSFTDPDSSNYRTILWDFGDGEYAAGTLSPTHVYMEDGLYTVELIVQDNDGSLGWDSLTVRVN